MEKQLKKKKRREKSSSLVNQNSLELEQSVPDVPSLSDFGELNLDETIKLQENHEDRSQEELKEDKEDTAATPLQNVAANVPFDSVVVNDTSEKVESSTSSTSIIADSVAASAIFSTETSQTSVPTVATKTSGIEMRMYPILAVDTLEELDDLASKIDPCEEALPTAPINVEENDVQIATDVHYPNEEISILLKDTKCIETRPILERPRPYISSEVKSLYNSYLLECREDKINEFLATVKFSYEGFELYELLCNYLRNCNQLTGCEKSLVSLKDQCDDFEKQVWKVTPENCSQNAVCMDKNNVVATHQFHVSNFDPQVLNQLNRVLKEIKELLKDSFSLYTYSVQLSKAQINHFFYKTFHHINLQSFDVQGYSNGYPTRDTQLCAQLLRTCISILFIFVRKSVVNQVFVRDIQVWLTNAVSLLQRMATLDDNLFILNHVIRCPPGTVAKWAGSFIQVPIIPIPASTLSCSNTFAHLNLDYSLVVLTTILSHVAKRDEFLKLYQASVKPVIGSSDSTHQWVMVDSDGEDDPEDVSFFKESDLISMLQQVPFDKIFRRILFIYKDGDEDRYDVRLITEQSVYKLLAFCSQLLEILGEGFVSYYTDRYRQLIKLIGRLMLHIVQYVTDHIENFLSEQQPRESFQALRVEYDSFLLRAVSILVRGKNIGTLQFLAAIPFHFVSTNMLWEIYNLLTRWDVFDESSSFNEDISSDFENELVSMHESDGFYLLTTLSNMAIAREGNEADFVRIVTLHLFQIGFLSPLTKDSCSKNARDLLSSLTHKYPGLISVLIQTIKPKMGILEKMSLFLLKELPFEIWKPDEKDFNLLTQWLLNFSVSSVENQISRFVFQSLNWDFDENGDLYLPYELHCKAALVVVETQSKWEKSQSILTESVKQVTRTTDGYLLWGWDLISRLHLHFFDRNNKCNVQIGLAEALRKMPTFESHVELEPLRKIVEENNPLGCLVSLLITPSGHSLPLLCSNGFALLEIILQSYKYEHVINALFFLTALFTGARDSLYKHEKFRNIMNLLLGADMTYVKMAKSLIVTEFPGRYTKMFGEMISAQLHQCERLRTTEKRLVRLWTEVLTRIDNWNKDNNVLYLLDVLAKYSFSRSDCRFFLKEYFVNLYKEIPSSSQSGFASLFSWSATTTTLLPAPSYPQMPYLMYLILNIEMELEINSGFWKSVCVSLGNPKCPVDSAVKKACNSSKFSTTSNFLTLYRFAQLALDVPLDHELQLVIWQKFFLRFLHRVVSSDRRRNGVGERFFEGMINTAFLKRMKKRLHELLEFHRENLSKVEEKGLSMEDNLSENPELMLTFLRTCLKLSTAFTLWIEDDKIHNESLYPPALPPQYLPDRLVNLIDGDMADWTDSVDYDALLQAEKNSAVSHITFMQRNCWLEPCKIVRSFNWNSSFCRTEEILKRLKSYDEPLKPPSVPIFSQVLPVATINMFMDVQSMIKGVDVHLKCLKEFAELFSMQISQHTALDCIYRELLPELYSNVKTEVLVNARCGGAKKWKSCSGPAQVVFKYSEARLNERVGHQIQQNRLEYHTLLQNTGVQPPKESVCTGAVFVEDFITNLIMQYRNMTSAPSERHKLHLVGIELFYRIVGLLSTETEFYLPTRQLFSSFLEVLGQEFISSEPSQSKRLITMCMDNPKLVESLAPHINLAKTRPSLLLDIYEKVVNIPKKDSDLAFVILTKYDVGSWLKTTKPKLNERSLLISYMWKAVSAQGIVLEKSSLMVHDTYRNHLKTMLLYDFPQHYGEILNYLLLSSEKQSVPLVVWYDFFNSLSRDIIRFRTGMDSSTRKREAKRFATEADVIQHQELIETAQLLASHFTKERLTHGIYGLYPKYRCYIEPLSCFVQIVSHTVVASSLRNSKGMLSQKIVEAVWPMIRDVYSPWIIPYDQKIIQQHCSQWIQQMNFDNSSLLQPWISTDSSLAMIYMNDFTDCVMFLAETLPGTTILFSYLWNFYVDNFAHTGVKEHVLHVVHQCFITIPWAMFWPTVCDLEVMNKVVEKYLPACHNFIGVVFAQVDWSNWIHNLIVGNQHNTALITKAHALVLNLTVRLANDCVARESPSWIAVMEKSQKIHWQYISSASLEPILNWYVMSVDPRVVLNLDSGHHMDKASLKLLKNASGYWDPGEVDVPSKGFKVSSSDCSRKRYLFVRLYVRLLVTASSKHKNLVGTHGKHFESAISDMINDIETAIRKYSHEDFSQQLKELVMLMSNHYLGTVTRNALIEWCEMHKNAPLSFMCSIIQLSFGVNVHSYVTVPLIETCIRLCFQHPETTWSTIVNVTPPVQDYGESVNFFDVSSKDGHYLLLYSLLVKKYDYLCQGGVTTIVFLTDLLKNMKPKESNETSLPLVYSIILKLCCALVDNTSENGIANIKKFLNLFNQHLTFVGDDKQSWGLLGALGLGKVSQLSIRGRLFARCLSLFVMVQMPVNAPIRLKPESVGHYICIESSETLTSSSKPHGDLQSVFEKLDALKLNRQYNDLLECINYTVDFIKNPNHSLSDADTLIENLNLYLFSEPFLIKRAIAE